MGSLIKKIKVPNSDEEIYTIGARDLTTCFKGMRQEMYDKNIQFVCVLRHGQELGYWFNSVVDESDKDD